jgi:uncharacterized protein
MFIVWDEPKRLANIDKHGQDFADLTLEFFERSRVVRARPPRWKAIGLLGRSALVVIFAPLGAEGVSIVSMRPASQKEWTLLHDGQTRA